MKKSSRKRQLSSISGTSFEHDEMNIKKVRNEKTIDIFEERFKFSVNATENASLQQQPFLKDSIAIAEWYVNNPVTKSVITNQFCIEIRSLKQFLLNAKIVFALPNKGKPLSWINEKQKNIININKMFWERVRKTKNQEEKEIICFAVGLRILHEVANISIQLAKNNELDYFLYQIANDT